MLKEIMNMMSISKEESRGREESGVQGGGLTEIVTEASWREIGKVLQTSYSGCWRVKICLKPEI